MNSILTPSSPFFSNTKKYKLDLNLLNFEDPEASEGCHYVLTSPRSLRACFNLGIKPADLLPRCQEDFDRAYGLAGEERRKVGEISIRGKERGRELVGFCELG